MRLRHAAEAETDPVAEAELVTQVARSLGLQERFGEAKRLLDTISSDIPEVRTRVALERGRLRNSSGNPEGAVSLFREAAAIADSAGLTFLHIDALHMLAIVDPQGDWHRQALATLEDVTDERTLRWLVSLHNNSGWTHFDAGRFDDALASFEASREAAVRWGTPQQVEWADEAIAETRAAASAG